MALDPLNRPDAPAVPPADRADQLERLRPEAAQALLQGLPTEEGAQVLIELEAKRAARLLACATTGQIIAWVQALVPNSAADLVARLAPERRPDVLAGLPPDHAAAVSELLRHPPDSAGGIMDNCFLSVRAEQTVAEGLERLRTSPARKSADVAYIYVTQETGRLTSGAFLRMPF